MSWLSKNLKKVGHFATSHYDDLGTAAGFVGGALIGQPIAGAAAGRAAGSLIGPEHAGHKTIGGTLKEGLKGAAYGAAGDALGLEGLVPGGQAGNINLGSLAKAGGLLKKGAGDLVHAAPAAGGAAPGWTDIASRGVGGVVDWAKQNPALILAGLSAAQGARQSSQSNATRDLVLKKLGEMDLNQRVNLGGVFADPGNPYAKAA